MKKILLALSLVTILLTSCSKQCDTQRLTYFDDTHKIWLDGVEYDATNNKYVSVERNESFITITSHRGKITHFQIADEELSDVLLDYTIESKRITLEIFDMEAYLYNKTWFAFDISR